MIYSFLSILLWLVHPLHISVTEIAFDEKEKELEIVTRIFIDDMETAIRSQRSMPTLDLLNPVTTTTDELVKEYVLKRIDVSLDGKAQLLKYLGFEKENEALICFIQVSQVKKWKTISIVNNVLLETFDDQSNLVHVTVRDKVRSLRLMKNNSSGSLTFDLKSIR